MRSWHKEDVIFSLKQLYVVHQMLVVLILLIAATLVVGLRRGIADG